MDIYEAIDALEHIYDSNVPMMDNEEATMFAKALESVWEFAQKHVCFLKTHLVQHL